MTEAPGTELVRARFLDIAAARHGEQSALRDDSEPWAQADAEAAVWLRSARFSKGTRDQYARVWRSWRSWCVLIAVPPLEARRSDIDAYALALERVGSPSRASPRPLSRRSVLRHLATLSSFYTRAYEDELADRNPVPLRGRPKVSRESRQPHLSVDELRQLLTAADAHSPRSGALVALLLLACLRISEALAARVEDLTYEAGTHLLWTRRKGDKGERLPLPPAAYVRLVSAIGGRREGLILVTSTGRALDNKAAWKTIRRLGRLAGIATPIGPHTLRHAYITRGHELGIPVDRLQVAAGHSSVDTTRGYDRSHLDPTNHPSFAIAADLDPTFVASTTVEDPNQEGTTS